MGNVSLVWKPQKSSSFLFLKLFLTNTVFFPSNLNHLYNYFLSVIFLHVSVLILSDILQMLIIHSENVNRFFVVEQNNARSSCVIYFRDYLSRSVLDGVERINSISGEEKIFLSEN